MIKNLYTNILITNTDFYGEIANYGDTVNIIKEPVVSVAAYARGQALVTQDLIDDQIQLVVNQANYFAFKVDDIEEKQSHVNWQDMAISSAAYSLKDTYDKDVLLQIFNAVPSGQSLGSNASNVNIGFGASATYSPMQAMARLNRYLDINNVPTDNRWFVADPTFWEKMQDENNKLMQVFVTGDDKSPLRNGKVTEGKIHGFTCYMSNNTPSSGTNAYTVALAGHMSSTATASQIAKTEVIRDNQSFADVVRGLHLYGRQVLRTQAVTSLVFSIVT